MLCTTAAAVILAALALAVAVLLVAAGTALAGEPEAVAHAPPRPIDPAVVGLLAVAACLVSVLGWHVVVHFT